MQRTNKDFINDILRIPLSNNTKESTMREWAKELYDLIGDEELSMKQARILSDMEATFESIYTDTQIQMRITYINALNDLKDLNNGNE